VGEKGSGGDSPNTVAIVSPPLPFYFPPSPLAWWMKGRAAGGVGCL